MHDSILNITNSFIALYIYIYMCVRVPVPVPVRVLLVLVCFDLYLCGIVNSYLICLAS